MPPAWALIAVLERVMRMRTAAGPTFDVAPGERGGFIAAQVATTAPVCSLQDRRIGWPLLGG